MKRTHFSFTLFSLAGFVVLTSFSPGRNRHVENDVFFQTNRFRSAHGLRKLINNRELNAIAQKHSADMASGQVDFGHNSFGERNAQAKRVVGEMHNFAENVAYGANSGREVVNMWETSPGHRRNMLGNYKFIGVGIAKDRQGRNYYTQVFAD